MRISAGRVGRKSFIAAGSQSEKKKNAERERTIHSFHEAEDVRTQKPCVR